METKNAALAFAALGQDTRLDLLRTLLEAGPSGLPAGEVALRLAVPASTLSFHLRALETVGLVAGTRRGRNLVYAAQVVRLRGLLAFLADACCGGRPSRCGDLHRLLDPEDDAMPHAPFNVLFLCTRNSARSIMAEAITRELAPDRFRAFSAGSDPSPTGPLPEVLAQLRALGHDVAGLRSKSWHEFTGADAPPMDFVIALCDMPSGQRCPDFGETATTAAWPLPDPAQFHGPPAERAALLNELYAGLRRRLELMAALPLSALDGIALQARLDELADPQAGAHP